MQLLSSPKLGYHTGGATITPNTTTNLKFSTTVGSPCGQNCEHVIRSSWHTFFACSPAPLPSPTTPLLAPGLNLQTVFYFSPCFSAVTRMNYTWSRICQEGDQHPFMLYHPFSLHCKTQWKARHDNGSLGDMENYTGVGRQKQYSPMKIKNRNQDLFYDYKNCTGRKDPTPAKN